MTPEQKSAVDALIRAAETDPYDIREVKLSTVVGLVLVQMVIKDKGLSSDFDRSAHMWVGKNGQISIDLVRGRKLVIKPWQVVLVDSIQREDRRKKLGS